MNKIYYNTIDSIHASETAVDKAVEAALNADQSGKVKEMKAKHRYIKPIGAIAACMAVIIALGVALFPRSENTFVLTAHAYDYLDTKLNENAFTSISNITSGGEAYIYDKNWEKVNIVLHNDQINLSCEGKNIDTVTYSLKNAIIGVNKKSNKLLRSEGKRDYFFDGSSLDYKPFGNGFGKDDNYYYTSVTTSYENQLNLAEDSVVIFSQYDITDQNRAMFEKYFKYNQPVELYTDEVDKADYQSAIENYYKDVYNDLAVTVTVNYKDGSKESKVIRFDVECRVLKNYVTKDEETPRTGEVYRYEVKLKAKIA